MLITFSPYKVIVMFQTRENSQNNFFLTKESVLLIGHTRAALIGTQKVRRYSKGEISTNSRPAPFFHSKS